MLIRLVDVLFSSVALILCAPLFVIVAAGIKLSSAGPVFYRARRAGIHGGEFVMYKFRTMHTGGGAGSLITGSNDPRVFAFGALLRLLKIDELPQCINILRGEMSVVGPRPEALEIVRESYTEAELETLTVLPGLLSPGTLYHFTHGEDIVGDEDPTRVYVDRVLRIKLALDRIYVRERSLPYNVRLMIRASWNILCKACGRRRFPDPPEMKRADLRAQPRYQGSPTGLEYRKGPTQPG